MVLVIHYMGGAHRVACSKLDSDPGVAQNREPHLGVQRDVGD